MELLEDTYDPDNDSDGAPLLTSTSTGQPRNARGAATSASNARRASTSSSDDGYEIDPRSTDSNTQCYRELKKLDARLARQENKTRGWLVPDETLQELAVIAPSSADALRKGCTGPYSPWLEKHASKYVGVCQRFLQMQRASFQPSSIASRSEGWNSFVSGSSASRITEVQSPASADGARGTPSRQERTSAPRKSAVVAAANLEQYVYEDVSASAGRPSPARSKAATEKARPVRPSPKAGMGGAAKAANTAPPSKRITLGLPPTIRAMPLKPSSGAVNRPRPS